MSSFKLNPYTGTPDYFNEENNACKIQGRDISNTDTPVNGQAITWNAARNEWEYTTPAGSGVSDHSALNILKLKLML
jgi:hypothetical protein